MSVEAAAATMLWQKPDLKLKGRGALALRQPHALPGHRFDDRAAEQQRQVLRRHGGTGWGVPVGAQLGC